LASIKSASSSSSSSISSSSSSSQQNQNTPEQISDEDRDEVVVSLRELLSKLEPNLEPRKFQDLGKRLETMEAKWREGSLTFPVARGLLFLARAVQCSNFDEADKIQVS
jgi:hypothetical protein